MKPYIETQPFSQDVRLHFLARNLSGRSSVMTNATFSEIEDGQLLPPAPLSMSREEAQDLADQLYAANIRPSAAAPIAQPVLPAELYAPAANEAVDLLKAMGYVYKQNSAGYLHCSAPIAQPVQPAQPMPKIPGHPELHTYAWSALEIETIHEYGKKCFDAGESQPVLPAPAARVPMTEDQIINLVIKCEKDWNKCAAESNQWKYLYWEEYAVVICRAIEAFHKIEIRS